MTLETLGVFLSFLHLYIVCCANRCLRCEEESSDLNLLSFLSSCICAFLWVFSCRCIGIRCVVLCGSFSCSPTYNDKMYARKFVLENL